nr:MAG TPA: portal protein [Caudoviricetes sp.]
MKWLKIFDKWIVKKAINILNQGEDNRREKETSGEIYEFLKGGNISAGKDLSEITYFTCLKVLSESIGKLSINLKDSDNNRIYDHDSLQMLKVRPNKFMTPTTFKALIEYHRNHSGNAYAYLKYEKNGKLEGIYPLESRNMQILIDNADIFQRGNKMYYRYLAPKTGKTYIFEDKEILHFKGGLSEDGLVGKSVRETLASTLKGVKVSQQYLNNLYEKGLTAKAILKYTGDFDSKKKAMLVNELANFATGNDSRGIIPIPLGMDLVPLDLKLTDSQFYELKKFTSLQIAAAFGVKPNHLNNYDKSSYANSEMQNLTFYIDTLLFILNQYEEEFNYKMLSEEERKKGLRFEFNVASILRGDLKTQAESITKYVSGSIYTINEARTYAGLPKVEDGEKILVNGSYVELKNVGNAYLKGGENNE